MNDELRPRAAFADASEAWGEAGPAVRAVIRPEITGRVLAMHPELAPGGRMRQEIYEDEYELSDWDGRHAVASTGAHVFREFWDRAGGVERGLGLRSGVSLVWGRA